MHDDTLEVRRRCEDRRPCDDRRPWECEEHGYSTPQFSKFIVAGACPLPSIPAHDSPIET